MKNICCTFLAVGIIFSGCGSQKVEAPKKQVVKKAKVKQENIVVSKTPKWIANPDIDGNLGAVGVVKLMKNKKKQKYIAKKLATAELQERKRVMMSSTVDKTDKVKNNGALNSELTQTIKQTSSHFNSDVIIQKAEYSDDESYYVWMVVKQ